MPYKLRKAPGRNLYWVVTSETKKKHSNEPIPLEKAKAQMRILEQALKLKGASGVPKPLPIAYDSRNIKAVHDSWVPVLDFMGLEATTKYSQDELNFIVKEAQKIIRFYNDNLKPIYDYLVPVGGEGTPSLEDFKTNLFVENDFSDGDFVLMSIVVMDLLQYELLLNPDEVAARGAGKAKRRSRKLKGGITLRQYIDLVRKYPQNRVNIFILYEQWTEFLRMLTRVQLDFIEKTLEAPEFINKVNKLITELLEAEKEILTEGTYGIFGNKEKFVENFNEVRDFLEIIYDTIKKNLKEFEEENVAFPPMKVRPRGRGNEASKGHPLGPYKPIPESLNTSTIDEVLDSWIEASKYTTKVDGNDYNDEERAIVVERAKEILTLYEYATEHAFSLIEEKFGDLGYADFMHKVFNGVLTKTEFVLLISLVIILLNYVDNGLEEVEGEVVEDPSGTGKRRKKSALSKMRGSGHSEMVEFADSLFKQGIMSSKLITTQMAQKFPRATDDEIRRAFKESYKSYTAARELLDMKKGPKGGVKACAPPYHDRTKGKASAFVLTCIDPRYTYDVAYYLQHKKELHADYDLFTLAGASVGAEKKEWTKTFFDNLELGIKLHGITQVWCFDHLDCGMYKATFGLKTDEDPKIHIQCMDKLKKMVAKKHPSLKFRKFIVNVQGHIKEIMGSGAGISSSKPKVAPAQPEFPSAESAASKARRLRTEKQMAQEDAEAAEMGLVYPRLDYSQPITPSMRAAHTKAIDEYATAKRIHEYNLEKQRKKIAEENARIPGPITLPDFTDWRAMHGDALKIGTYSGVKDFNLNRFEKIKRRFDFLVGLNENPDLALPSNDAQYKKLYGKMVAFGKPRCLH